MALTESVTHWTPMGIHGTLVYDGEPVEEYIRAQMKKLAPRISFVDIQYIINTHEDGSKTITFEIK